MFKSLDTFTQFVMLLNGYINAFCFISNSSQVLLVGKLFDSFHRFPRSEKLMRI